LYVREFVLGETKNHHGMLPLLLRAIKWCHSVLVSCVKVRTGVDEQTGALDSAVPCRPMERRETVSVDALHVGPLRWAVRT